MKIMLQIAALALVWTAKAQGTSEAVLNFSGGVVGNFNDWFWVKSVGQRCTGTTLPIENKTADVSIACSDHATRIYVAPGGEIMNAWTERSARPLGPFACPGRHWSG